MTDVIKLGKRTFTWSVVLMTIMWSVGAAALVPLVATAADCSAYEAYGAGTVVKSAGNTTVYELDADGKARYYPHSNVFFSWHSSYDVIKEVPTGCFVWDIAGKGVSPRSGSTLIKTVEQSDVYAVLPGNVRVKLASAEVAAALYGATWYTNLMDVHAFHWGNYTDGATISTAVPHNGMLVKTDTSGDVYEVVDGKLSKVDGSLSAMLTADVQTVSASVFATLENSGLTVTPASLVADPTQSGTEVVSPPTASGNLTVSLAASTPASGYAFQGAARVEFTKVTFTAGSADVTVDQFKVKRTGVAADDNDFSAINVVDPNGNLLNDTGKTPNSDHEVTFTENITVPAGTSKTYILVGDMVSTGITTGNVPKLALTAVTLVGTGSVTGLPVEGNAMTTSASLTLGTVTLAQGNTIGSVTKQVGAENVNFMNLKVTNTGSVDTKSVKLEKVVLYNAGTTADSDVSGYELKYNGTVVGTGVMANKYLTFDLSACTDDCTIAKGYDRTFEVYGDLTGGSGRTVELYVYTATNVLIKDVNNSVYLTPTNNAANANINDIITVSQGKLNVTKTLDVPTGNVSGNATNVALASFNYKVVGEPIDIRKTVFKITTTGTVVPAGLDSLVLYNSAGVALIGSIDGVGAAVGVGYATSSDTFTLQPGDNILTVKATIDNTAVANDTIKIDLDMTNTTNFVARGVNSSLDITLGTATPYATPNALVQGPTKTVATSALTVTTLTVPAATTYAPGSDDKTLVRVELDASASSEDLKVTQFKALDETGATALSIDIQNIRLFVDKDGDSYNGSGTAVALTEVLGGTDSDAGDDETFTWNLSGDDQFIVKAGKKVIGTSQPSITSARLWRHSSNVLPVAHIPGSSGTAPQ